jgi:peptide/nickel transport system permease protein
VRARGELRRLVTNPALVVGVVCVLGLLAMGVFGLAVAPKDPNAGSSLIITEVPGGNDLIKVPPTYPDAEHPLGTDQLGRDQWSRVLGGARLTLTIVLAATLTRLAIGLTLGLVTGWYGGPLAQGVRTIAAGVNAIPQLLLAIMLVLVTRPLGPAGFVLSLALVGWPELVEFVRAEVGRVRGQPFMEAARAVGARDPRLVTGHLATALSPQLITVAALETGAVLLLLAELGLVGIFLGGATFLSGEFGESLFPKARAPEWGQMLGTVQFYAFHEQLATLIPALFVVLASASFVLLADGLLAASDPFSEHRVLPKTFGAVTKVMAGALSLSAVAFVGFNVNPTALTMEEGRVLAAQTAEKTWPGSEFVAGVARYAASAHGLERPEKLTYYYRNAENEVLRISFVDADRLAVEVRQYESEDQIDFATLKELPAGSISYETPLTRAEQRGGQNYLRSRPNYLVRVKLTWPSDQERPLYEVVYGSASGAQIDPLRICCFDATTGVPVESAVGPPQHVDPSDAPWAVPAECEVSPTVFRGIDRRTFGFFVDGDSLSVGTPQPGIYYQGDNFIQLAGGQGAARLERAANRDGSPGAEVLNVQPTTTTDAMAVSFATLRLPVPGCWTVTIAVGGAALEYTLYAYPWQCRRQHEQLPALPGIERLPCVRR